MNIIVNVDENWAIGNAGGLIFPIPEDLKFFKRHTLGKAVVMGRLTLASLPGARALLGRDNIVLTHDTGLAAPGLVVCNDLPALGRALERYATEDVYVIGGARVYALLLEYCDTAYVTRVQAAAPQADSFFPALDALPGWRLSESSAPQEHDGVVYRFCTYTNDTPKTLSGQ